jgi:hypothetical protein
LRASLFLLRSGFTPARRIRLEDNGSFIPCCSVVGVVLAGGSPLLLTRHRLPQALYAYGGSTAYAAYVPYAPRTPPRTHAVYPRASHTARRDTYWGTLLYSATPFLQNLTIRWGVRYLHFFSGGNVPLGHHSVVSKCLVLGFPRPVPRLVHHCRPIYLLRSVLLRTFYLEDI